MLRIHMDEIMNTGNIETLYRMIKLTGPSGNFYKGRDLKLQQLQDYKKQMDAVLNKISKKKQVHLVESCAGNCFLTFYLAWHYRREFPGRVRFSCVDRNGRLIEEARNTAAELGMDEIRFYTADVGEVALSEPAQVVYSLHACDTATDATVALGIAQHAKYILSVSCCQFTARKRMRGRSLSGMTEFAIFKERMTEMAADAMRGQLLTVYGYKPDIFAFTAPRNTGKNIMLRAERIPASNARSVRARERYADLKRLTGLEPELVNLLPAEEHTLINAS